MAQADFHRDLENNSDGFTKLFFLHLRPPVGPVKEKNRTLARFEGVKSKGKLIRGTSRCFRLLRRNMDPMTPGQPENAWLNFCRVIVRMVSCECSNRWTWLVASQVIRNPGGTRATGAPNTEAAFPIPSLDTDGSSPSKILPQGQRFEA